MPRRHPNGTTYGQKVVARMIAADAQKSADAMRTWLLDCPAISEGAKSLLTALLDQEFVQLNPKDPTNG